jgi:hypothetical protein
MTRSPHTDDNFTESLHRLLRELHVPGVYVRHEALFVRMEVEDLDLPAVAAAGWSWRQPKPRVGGEGGSGLDKVASSRHCRMGRARWGETGRYT